MDQEQIERTSTLSNLNPDDIEEIQRLLRESKKIQAIKRYRAKTRVGLKPAKDIIEREQEFLGLGGSGSGCFSILLICIGLLTICGLIIIRSLL
jgi:hypothetical protein